MTTRSKFLAPAALLVAFLIAWSGVVSAVTLPDPTEFSVVIQRGDVSRAKEWLDAGLSPDFNGSLIGSGLMIGAWEGNIPMMQLFLERGANINHINEVGEQALLHAAWRGQLEAVKWLVEHGASLSREGKEWAALHYAAFAGHEEVVRYLLEKGADINGLSTNGSTALMMAAREGKENIALGLLQAGARGDIVNEWGDTAVTWAMKHNNVKIAKEIASKAEFDAVMGKSFLPEPRSQPLPDAIDSLLVQATRLEAVGQRKDALKLYRDALTGIKKVDRAAMNKRKTTARAVKGMVISARRGHPAEQTAGLTYSTPAINAIQQTDEIEPTTRATSARRAVVRPAIRQKKKRN